MRLQVKITSPICCVCLDGFALKGDIVKLALSATNTFQFSETEAASTSSPNSEISESPATDRQQLKAAIALVRQHANVLHEAGAYSLKSFLNVIEQRAAV